MTACRPIRTCPDCAAVPVDLQLVHADTCPHASAQDEVMTADRGWFEANPHAQSYSRPVSRSEVLELQMIGVIPGGWDAAGHVHVTRVGLGVRTRTFSDVWIFPGQGAA